MNADLATGRALTDVDPQLVEYVFQMLLPIGLFIVTAIIGAVVVCGFWTSIELIIESVRRLRK